MSLIICDGFETYGGHNSTLVRKAYLGTNSISTTTTAKRSGNYGLDMYQTAGAFAVALPTPTPTVILGLAYRGDYADHPRGAKNYIIRFYDENFVTQCTFGLNSSGYVTFNRGEGATLLGTSTHQFAVLATWQYLEFKVKVDDSAGTYELRVDGATNFSGSSQDTKASTTSSNIAYVWIGPFGMTAYDTFIDDFYLCDGLGTVNNDFLGPCVVESVYPTGSGYYSQLVGSDGDSTNNYAHLDDSTTTEYVYSSTTGEKDTYTKTALTGIPTNVYGVSLISQTSKFTGTKNIRPISRISNSDYTGGTTIVPASNVFNHSVVEVNPATSSLWTISEINSAELGVEII